MRAILNSVLVGCALVCTGSLNAAQPTPLTQKYMDVFSGSASEEAQLHALNQLQWSGLSDPRLFDLLEQKLLDLYPNARGGKQVELASWYAKSLGTSGQDRYAATLQAIVDSKANSKVRKYAGEGLNNIAKYGHWNPIISSTDGIDPDQPEQLSAFVNMLSSDDWALRNMAVKRIYADNVHDPYVLDALDEVLRAEYKNDHGDRFKDQTVAWMARALASSRMPDYRSTLEEVAANAANSKLRSYAKKYLKQYY